jgi:hypothetical protein
VHWLLCKQKQGQSPLTDIGAVKATTAARTKERRVVCEDVMWDRINRGLTVLGKTPFFLCAEYS